MNDNQQVLDLLNQTNNIPAPMVSRRTFCTLTGLSLISFLLPGCSNNTDLQTLSQEDEFGQFFDIIFPASNLGLVKFNESALARVQHLTNKHALYVIQLYKHFKKHLWLIRDMGTKEYNRTMGEACLSQLLNSKHANQYNHALDIIYYKISNDNKLITALWGRKFSLTDKKCVYWDNYDQAIS